jgi:hypothetical protein
MELGQVTITPVKVRPTSGPRRPLTTVSTSGSSGMVYLTANDRRLTALMMAAAFVLTGQQA